MNKENKAFDILENAENDSMERLIEKCPEMSDEKYDKILAMSERKFKTMKKDMERTNKNIKMTENDVVEGVERSRRPAWLTPLSTAASIVLIAGIIIGSTALLKRNSNIPNTDHDMTPVITATTSVKTGKEPTLTDKNGSTVTATVTTAAGTPETTKTSSEDSTENTDEAFDIKDITGTWTYQEADGINTVYVSAKNIATVVISEDGTYTYTDADGNTSNGTIETGSDEIGGTKITMLRFTEGSSLRFSTSFFEETRDEMNIGNGGMARLVRGSQPLSKSEKLNDEKVEEADITDITGIWTYQESDGNNTVDVSAKNIATVTVNADWSYTRTTADGNTTYGTIKKEAEELNGVMMPHFRFYESSSLIFDALYVNERSNDLYIGNGGMARLTRGHLTLGENADSGIDVKILAGQWTYQEAANGYTTVDVSSRDNGTVTISADGSYSYTNAEGNTSYGTVKTGIEEIGGTKLYTVIFYEGNVYAFGGYYHEGAPEIISIGNGGIARLVR